MARRLASWARRLLLCFLFGIALAAAGFTAGWFYLRAHLPLYDDTRPLTVLKGPVSVWRTAEAIPVIDAESWPDAWRTLGYLHAEERLFQMELTRLAAAAFLARYRERTPKLRAMVESVLPASPSEALRLVTGDLWIPTVVRPTPRLRPAEVVFRDDCLVVVRAGATDVTLPWCAAEVAPGDRLQVELSPLGQPLLAVVKDREGHVRVIDF